MLICIQFIYSQDELEINYQEIKQKIEDKNSPPYYYPGLLTRFNNFDQLLTMEEYSFIYYGFTFQEDYLNKQPDEKELLNLIDSEQYELAIEECKKILMKNPVSLAANNYMGGFSLFKLDKPEDEWKKYQKRYRELRKVIAYSGNGLSCETAFKVIYISDEYNMMYSYFNIEKIHKQQLVNLCDKFDIEASGNYQVNEIYFDISRKLIRQQELIDNSARVKESNLNKQKAK